MVFFVKLLVFCLIDICLPFSHFNMDFRFLHFAIILSLGFGYEIPICSNGNGDICHKEKYSRRYCNGYLKIGHDPLPSTKWIKEGNKSVILIKVLISNINKDNRYVSMVFRCFHQFILKGCFFLGRMDALLKVYISLCGNYGNLLSPFFSENS